MKCYSLISCSSDYYCIGIYTSLDNLYVALKTVVTEELKEWSKKEIKTWYEVKEVYLDNEPLECYEFSRYGKKIKINWDKVFQGVNFFHPL